MSVTIDQITKYYGKQKALNRVGFTLNRGEICGFLGPNGAGKSTLMKIVTGYIDEYEGEVMLEGVSLRKEPLKARALTGYLPEHNPLYPEMYIREYLQHVARLYRIPKPAKRTDEIMEQTGLLPEEGKKIGQLSKGFRQRVGLAQALIHDPQILILDEPMTGLDPNQLEEIRTLITRIGKDKTVMLSTHIMQEVEAICDRIVIIDKGEIVADRTKESLRPPSGGNTK
ncbi:MAG: ATP-binding cassette domain-containing protein [Culturomica sp.]|jgi:ABC-2 type transport system ATP-binding protein|nr:ATP-binding cassette domain-containing protein [Culturomica sp.]